MDESSNLLWANALKITNTASSPPGGSDFFFGRWSLFWAEQLQLSRLSLALQIYYTVFHHGCDLGSNYTQLKKMIDIYCWLSFAQISKLCIRMFFTLQSLTESLAQAKTQETLSVSTLQTTKNTVIFHDQLHMQTKPLVYLMHFMTLLELLNICTYQL
jgi:hypothetical protein